MYVPLGFIIAGDLVSNYQNCLNYYYLKSMFQQFIKFKKKLMNIDIIDSL